MNTTFEKEESAEDEFSALFEFDTKEDKISHKASMIMFRFLSEIEKMTEGKINKKGLSSLIGTSPSYITQLFRGDKLINLITLAKFEEALDSEFDIKLRKNYHDKKKTANVHNTDVLIFTNIIQSVESEKFEDSELASLFRSHQKTDSTHFKISNISSSVKQLI